MAFFTEEEAQSLTLERMILHVIGHEQEFSPQPEIEAIDHSQFFLTRIHDASASAVYKFAERSPTKRALEEIASGSSGFEAGGQELARRFAQGHSGNSSNGAFFVIELGSADPGVSFFCMIKYDYSAAVELAQQEGRNVLRQIVQAFIHDRKAMQKCCIVRMRDGIAELDISAVDRMGKAPDLTHYFVTFLDAYRDRHSDELSETLNEALRAALTECKPLVPGLNVADAVAHAKSTLHRRDQVDDDAIREAIHVATGRPVDEQVRSAVEKSVNKALRKVNLEGLTFQPNARFFRTRPRHKVTTQENVVIEYPGELEGHSVTRERRPEGGWTITVRTNSELAKDETVPSKPRGST